MPNIDAPRGFKPVRHLNGSPYNGATNAYKLASGYGTAIYSGDVVKLTTDGVLNKAGANEQIRGVAVGFKWVGADGSLNVKSYWPAGTVTLGAVPADVLVVDDPDILFEAQVTNGTAALTQAIIGATSHNIDAGGNAATGISGMGLDYANFGTDGRQWRIVAFLERPDNDKSAAYARVLATPLLHDFRVQTGI